MKNKCFTIIIFIEGLNCEGKCLKWQSQSLKCEIVDCTNDTKNQDINENNSESKHFQYTHLDQICYTEKNVDESNVGLYDTNQNLKCNSYKTNEIKKCNNDFVELIINKKNKRFEKINNELEKEKRQEELKNFLNDPERLKRLAKRKNEEKGWFSCFPWRLII